MQELASWQFGKAGLDAASDLRGDLADFAPGSRNLLPNGLNESTPFKGLTSAGNGGRVMVQVRDSWGSIDDDGATPGKGSFFSSVAEMLVYIGQGQLRLEGTAIAGAIASNVLRFLLRWSGSYTHANSGPFVAGLAEPSAPDVGILESELYGTPNLSGTVSIKYARFRKTTGGRSRSSATSQVLVVVGKAIYAVVPAALTGQTHHIFFGTDTKLGGIGLHYRIARANPFTNEEYTETDVERTVTITSITSTDKLNAASGTFSAGDIGKLVENVSGFTFAAGTTVAEVVSSSQVRLSAAISSGTSGSVKLVAYAGSVRRGVALNWTPSDLVEETAWIYDFPPPTGSHAFQLEDRMFVAAYADASAKAVETAAAPDTSASSSSPGTALCPSLKSHFESYDPRFPIYLPEKVIDILSDGMESYKFIGGQNGIYAAQYLNVSNAAPLTLSVLLRGEGIASPSNWCAGDRAIYLFTGQPVRIIEGGTVDKTFGAKVRALMAGWVQANVVVAPHPKRGGFVYSHGSSAFFYDEATGRWSTELGLLDGGGTGTILSAVATRARLVITMLQSGARNAYYFDEGGGNFVVGIGHYQNTPRPEKQKSVQRIVLDGVSDQVDTIAGYVGIHANTLPTYVTDGAVTDGLSVFTSPGSNFLSDLVGSYLLIRGGSSGQPFLLARIKAILSPTTLRMGTPVADLSLSGDLDASATVSGAYTLIARRIYVIAVARTGSFEAQSGELFLPGFSSYAVSLLLKTNGTRSQPLKTQLEGMINEEEGWTNPSARFNV